MYTHGLDPLLHYKQRHQELLTEARHVRLVNEALKGRQPEIHLPAKILAFVGKKLAILGASLEERYGVQPQIEVPMDRSCMPCE